MRTCTAGRGHAAGLLLFLISLILLFPLSSLAEQKAPVSFKWDLATLENPVDITLAGQKGTRPITALAVMTITPGKGWHAYTDNPGETGMPTRVTASLQPQGIPLSSLYPPGIAVPDVFEPEKIVNIYEHSTPIFIPLEKLPLQGQSISAAVRLLLCSATSCWPVNRTEALHISSGTPPVKQAEDQPWWPQASAMLGISKNKTFSLTQTEFTPAPFSPGLEVSSMTRAALFAFLAGLILNFMPCVLPVITLKLRSFIPAVGTDGLAQKRLFRTHNLFFALGMLLYFLALAVLISFTGMAWGEIFQQPGAVLTLTVIVFALSLSLFGLYDLPVIDLKAAHGAGKKHPHLESLFTGILATVLATPCSGPFLGGVLAWALIQPPMVIATVLGCIGLGMSSPYLLMAAFPSLFRFLPRPGDWTVTLERLLGFLLMGTCVYLFALLPAELHITTLMLFWVVGLGAWIWGKWTSLSQTAALRMSIRGGVVLAVAVVCLFLFLPTQEQDPWTDFSKAQFEEMAGTKNILVDFTADWCPNCKFLEKTVLTPGNMAALQKRYDLELLRVDLTRKNPIGSDLLKRLGSRSIPVLAIFPADRPGSPIILRDLFTEKQLKAALAQTLDQ